MEKETIPPKVDQLFREIAAHLKHRTIHVDLHSKKPPFFPNNFALWRSEAYAQLEKEFEPLSENQKNELTLRFHDEVDVAIFEYFRAKMLEAYYEQILYDHSGAPEELDMKKYQQEYKICDELKSFAIVLAKWYVDIELIVDMFEKSQLFGFIKPEKDQRHLYKNLKKQLSYSENFSICEFTLKLIKQSFKYAILTVSKAVWSKGMASSNIQFATLLLLYYSFIGTSTLPFQLVLPKMNFQFLFGGVAGSYVLNKIAENIDRNDALHKLKKLTESFKIISKNMRLFLAETEECLDRCLRETRTEEKEKLATELEAVLSQKLQHPEQLKQIQEQLIELRILTEQQEDDWTILSVDKEELENFELLGCDQND